MHIEIDLDPTHTQRLHHLQETWSQPLDQVIARLIDIGHTLEPEDSAKATMLASEAVLRRDWETQEEDAAWAHL